HEIRSSIILRISHQNNYSKTVSQNGFENTLYRMAATDCLLPAVRKPPACAAAGAGGLTRYKPFPNPPLLYTLTQFNEKYLCLYKLKEIV
ncbi:hypothetical protein LIZ31_17050, partial [Eggerthella lenta]|nr:hypothetical protein [Eggerthella lenta]